MMNKSQNNHTFSSSMDAVIEVYMKDVDRTLIRENLKLSAPERTEKFLRVMEGIHELREAGKRMRSKMDK